MYYDIYKNATIGKVTSLNTGSGSYNLVLDFDSVQRNTSGSVWVSSLSISDFGADDAITIVNPSNIIYLPQTYSIKVAAQGSSLTMANLTFMGLTLDINQRSQAGFNALPVGDINVTNTSPIPSLFIGKAYGDDVLTGTTSADLFIGTTGNDAIDGGTGTDTIEFSAPYANYSITKTTTGFTVKDNTLTNSTTTLTNVERLQFSDKTIALDTNGDAGQVYRLYQAAFNRTPDKGGLGDWIYGMDHGVSLLDVSAGFINSAEFKSMYGANPTNSELVTKFYENVLHRAPEQAGYDYWMNQLNSHAQTATQVLAGFSESTENQAQVIGVIQNGFEYTQHA